MKIDAHYYAVLAYARAVGFKKEVALQIAYASQFVDDAKYNQIVLQDKPPVSVKCDRIGGKDAFFNMATCHDYFKIYTFNYHAMINNTSAFHFVPGCEGANFPKKLRCKRNSKVIQYIAERAIKEPDPVKLGMVLHPFADTFSHHGFSGLLSKVNDIKNLRRIPVTFRDYFFNLFLWFLEPLKWWISHFMDRITPAYGHAQAREYPDIPFLVWRYRYDYTDVFSYNYQDSGEIDNRQLYIRAFKQIKIYLEKFLIKHPQFKDPGFFYANFKEMEALLVARRIKCRRIYAWKKFLRNRLFINSDTCIHYDRKKWLNEAFQSYEKVPEDRRRLEKAVFNKDFDKSNWYRFYHAVKWYRNKFFEGCKDNGLDIPK